MLKRLTMIAIGLGIIGFCMGMMPQKAEAAYVDFKVYHSHIYESGKARIGTVEKWFTQYQNPYQFYMGWVNGGWKWTHTRMNCGNQTARYIYVNWSGWQTITHYVWPY